MTRFAPVTDDIVAELTRICGPANVSRDPLKLGRYSHDQVPEKRYHALPEVVVMPGTAAEVQAVVRLASRALVPITPRGAGSGLSGGAVPACGGISLSLEKMNRIVEIDRDNMVAVVEPGVLTNALDEALRPLGLFFAGYPLSEEICFIGGNAAHNAGGGRAVKYGVTKRYITGLEVVTAAGDLLTIGGKRFKDVTGYDLVSLLVGSEGTLGIFTRIYVRLLARPAHRGSLLALFGDSDSALGVVPEILVDKGLTPSSVEFMDGMSLAEACKALKETLPFEKAGAALLLETDGPDQARVDEELAVLEAVCRTAGAIEILRAPTEKEAGRFWKIRKQAVWALRSMSTQTSIEDIVVPIGSVRPFVRKIQEVAEKHHLRIPTFGHAADGNLHSHPLKNPGMSDDEWDVLLPTVLKELYAAAAALGGTISGEHGIGSKRKAYLPLVMPGPQIALLRAIKMAFDPKGILNPGKIFDSE
ncbi:MAG: FAD-binding oxidoreductase [Spirochaetia bacterium]